MALTATHLPFCILYCSWIKYHVYISLRNCKVPQLYYILSHCPTVVFWGTALLGQSRLFLSLEWLLWDKLRRVGCLHRYALPLSMQLFVCLFFSLHCWHHCLCLLVLQFYCTITDIHRHHNCCPIFFFSIFANLVVIERQPPKMLSFAFLWLWAEFTFSPLMFVYCFVSSFGNCLLVSGLLIWGCFMEAEGCSWRTSFVRESEEDTMG